MKVTIKKRRGNVAALKHSILCIVIFFVSDGEIKTIYELEN
jgi:hypothetical protein